MQDDDELDLDLHCQITYIVNVEGRDYVTGYITHKLKLSALNDRKPNSWISLKGEGRLKEPNEKLTGIVAKCDINLDQVLGKDHSDLNNPLEKLKTEILNKNPDFPSQIVTLL